MTPITIEAEAVPLEWQEDGRVLRVRGTRVPLDVVVAAFHDGASAEEIVLRYPSLDLADVYGVLAYYLRHRDRVDGYLAERRATAAAVKRAVQARADMNVIRRRLESQGIRLRGANDDGTAAR
jgi:uncharacterized protein (DUF433 family)